MTRSADAVVLDHTALLALGSGNRMLSGLVAAEPRRSTRHVYVPALCLAAATAERPAVGEHVGMLPALEVVELGFAGAVMVGRTVATGTDWKVAHAAVVGRPDPEWPDGRLVLTTNPQVYAGLGVATARVA